MPKSSIKTGAFAPEEMFLGPCGADPQRLKPLRIFNDGAARLKPCPDEVRLIMRLFVALDIEEAIQQRLSAYVCELKPRVSGVRFVNNANFHVTLKFLGEVASPEEVTQRLRQIEHAPVALNFRGAGFFPNPRAPRIFWAGMEAPLLADLAKKVDTALSGMGFAAEKEYHPHLTLARSGSGRPRPYPGERSPEGFQQLARLVDGSAAPEFGTMTAHEFYLYESRLAPGGAIYTKLERFALGGTDPIR
ncbi:MAG: RNA 2',3'-cyclic phosphodiesterase [Acidobacteriota bacterium]|nr:RNA 2',3'-cyclic phosphodiesterase [Acidobacteriota bacterium]